jgi:hypothetical protein
VFTPTVRAPGHQAEYVVFSSPVIKSPLTLADSVLSLRLASSGVWLPLNPHYQQCLYRPLPLLTRPPALFLRIFDIIDALLHLSRCHFLLFL